MKIIEQEALNLLAGFIPPVRKGKEADAVEDQQISLSIGIDNSDGRLVLKAGMAEDQGSTIQVALDPLEPFRQYQAVAIARRMDVAPAALRQVSGFIYRLIHFFVQKDCLILDVTPITIRAGREMELGGCRMEIDDDATFRQPDLQRIATNEENRREQLARSRNLTYVELDGDIAIVSGGAGSTMAVVDMVQHLGGRPANFIDAMGGAGLETIRNLVDLVLSRSESDPGIKVILLTMHLSATPMKQIVETFCSEFQERSPAQPVVGYLHAGGGALLNMPLDKGRELLQSCGMTVFPDLREAIREAVRLSQMSP